VDGHIAQWRVERPDLSEPALRAMAVFGRLARLAAVAGGRIDGALTRRYGLTSGDFDVLAALRRSGEPYTLTPGALAKAMMLSPSATTTRLDRLERKGLIARELDPGNRRSMLVSLTDEGFATVEEAVVLHVTNEQRLLRALSAEQIAEMDDLLRTLLAGLPAPEDG
jgi:DNA-binding MarR family transcriptional regulator